MEPQEEQAAGTLTLNAAEQKLAIYLAKARNATNRNGGVTDRRRCGADIDLDGVGAELAFCRLWNLYPDLSLHPRSAATDEGDATLPDGRRVDVKATRHPRGQLIAVTWKKERVELYALMVGTFPVYRFVGVQTAQALLHPDTITDLGYGPTHALPQERLLPLEEVL